MLEINSYFSSIFANCLDNLMESLHHRQVPELRRFVQNPQNRYCTILILIQIHPFHRHFYPFHSFRHHIDTISMLEFKVIIFLSKIFLTKILNKIKGNVCAVHTGSTHRH